MADYVNSLDLNVWEADLTAADTLTLTRFRLSPQAQETLMAWSRESSKRAADAPVSLRLGGLSEILAWFVPELAFLRRNHWDTATNSRHLSFFLMGDQTADLGLRSRVQTALTVWLTLIYPDKSVEMRQAIAATATDASSWTLVEVNGALQPQIGACPRPADAMLFDAIAAHALTCLAGETLTFRGGDSRLLVAKAARSEAFNGVELVAFPPRHEKRGLWSEVITLYTPTYPERGKLHILARASIRNWGSVGRATGYEDPDRQLDVFMPALEGAGGGAYRHTSFDLRVRPGPRTADGERGPLTGIWAHKDDQKIFELLRRLTGQAALAPDELVAPVIDQDGLWVLPRLGSRHGDKFLSGGTGMTFRDRHDIGESLDRVLSGSGFTAAAPMSRVRKSAPLTTPFSEKPDVEVWAVRRRAVSKALEAVDAQDLQLHVFQCLDDGPERVVAALVEELGPPDEQTPDGLAWNDGLRVRLRVDKAGPLGALVTWPEVDAAQAKGLNKAQIRSVQELNKAMAFEAAQKAMAAHAATARDGERSVGWAVLEMPESLKGEEGDPFLLARRALAQAGLLPQVVLTSTSEVSEDTLVSKYGAAVSDCLRMLGVLPVEDFPRDLQPAALTVIQRNADIVGGKSRKGHAFPLAARTHAGRLECAVPDEAGVPQWAPYAATVLKVLRGEYGKFGRGRQEETVQKFETFFTMALEDIDRAGPALLICEGETLAHKFSALENGQMVFDRLTLANRILTPTDLPNIRLVRTSPDAKRQPYYHHDTSNTWPTGFFRWDGAQRTFYALKAKPPTVSTAQHNAGKSSRHLGAEEAAKPPKAGIGVVSSQMDEICVAFHQAGDDPSDLAILVHRLRRAHAQYDFDTARPFPLHELRKLGGGVML